MLDKNTITQYDFGMNETALPPIAVLGALNLDMCGATSAQIRLHDSNPGSITLRAGGVGHNIAKGLAAHGHAVELLALLGDDEIAGILRTYCARECIGLSYAREMKGASSSAYLCVHGEDGDLCAAVSDMDVMLRYTPDIIAPRLSMLNASALVAMDANLPGETIAYAVRHITARLLLDPVSGFKAERVRDIIGSFFAVKPNRLEAEVLSGQTDADKAADWFLGRGVRQVYISLGGEGLFYADAQARGIAPAPALHPRSTNGAGDAQTAGIAAGILLGHGVQACAALGIRYATDYLQAQGGK